MDNEFPRFRGRIEFKEEPAEPKEEKEIKIPERGRLIDGKIVSFDERKRELEGREENLTASETEELRRLRIDSGDTLIERARRQKK